MQQDHDAVSLTKVRRHALRQGGRKLADWDALGADDEAGGGGGAEDAELQAAIQLSLAESPLKGAGPRPAAFFAMPDMHSNRHSSLTQLSQGHTLQLTTCAELMTRKWYCAGL